MIGCVVLGYGAHHLTWWGLLGFIPILSAACAFCPLYLPFQIDTTYTDVPHDHA